MIYCIFGQPGAGKTTISNLLAKHPELQDHGKWAIIDGDHIRELFDNKDYSRAGRLKNCDFAISLAQYLITQDINVIVALVMPYRESRDKMRNTFPGVYMIELAYDTAEGRRDPSRLVADYELEESEAEIINTSKVSIEDTVEYILSL